MWDLSCRDWEDRIRSGRSLVPDLPLYRAEADLAVQFFDALRLPDVPGKPRLREAAGDWFRDIVRALFGARDPATNVRHIRELFAMVGKGNSKTSYGAGLMVVALLMNERPRGEYLLVAPTQSTADLAFAQAVGMIEADPELLKRFHPRDHLKEIRDRLNGAKLKVKTFGLDVLTGPKPVGVLLDELHLLGRSASTAKVMRQIRGGLEKNTEGFLLIITTQSDEPPTGAFKDELLMARSVRDGRFKGRTLPILYELPPAIAKDPTQWQDPSCWPMVMPNLGRSLHLDSMIADWRAEQEKGEHAIQVWASQHLNIEIGVGIRSDGWAGATVWERGAEPRGLTLDDLIERCEVIALGIDGGGADDLFGIAAIGRERGTRRWLAWAHALISPEGLERRKDNRARYDEFRADGDLTFIQAMPEDVDQVVEIVRKVRDAGLLARVGMDPMGLGFLVDALAEIDVTQENGLLAGIRQGMALMNAIKSVERKLIDGTFRHGGQPLMAWCAGNAKVSLTPTGMRISRDAAGYGKIDPLVALFDAADIMTANPEPPANANLAGFLADPLFG